MSNKDTILYVILAALVVGMMAQSYVLWQVRTHARVNDYNIQVNRENVEFIAEFLNEAVKRQQDEIE